MEIGFSLGSNVGDRLVHLREAKRRILEEPGARFVAQSPVYETEPVDVNPVYQVLKFLNAVLVVESPRDAPKWLEAVGRIERIMGRVRMADRNAPRTIDIDIVYAGDTRTRKKELALPHPRWAERAFVVKPLADVRPDLELPGAPGMVQDVLAGLDTTGVKLFCETW